MIFSVVFTSSAAKEIENLPSIEVKRILKRIESLSKNPLPSGSIKLKGKINLWRIRSGNYRIIYSIEKELLVIEIIRIRHRNEAYKKK